VLSQFVETLTSIIQQIVVSFGAPGITLVALFENLFPPTPSEFLYPLAGKMAADGQISLVAIVIAGVVGSLMGSLLYYRVGYWLGEERSRVAIDRYGKIRLLGRDFRFVSVEEFDKALRLFERHGGKIVFVARLMPLVHGVVSIPAGVTRMKLLPFLLYTAVGAALWIGPLSLFGYWLGNNWEQVLYYLDVYENIIYVLIVAAVVYYVIRRVQRSRNKDHIKSLGETQ
jgi:membrane protein DedA with SNARE-associated domain